ncbi:MAG: transposase [Gammaproteobacteria bacterium]|nr:transposase [Gammaproteobacteria bacterium]
MLSVMGYPRYLLVPPDSPGIYHCVSRCVRRAFLCGADPVTGRSYEHRKQWLEDRILELAQHFAVAVHSYAVMSNHFHVVVEIDPDAPRHWSDEEIARRWLSLSTSSRTAGEPFEVRVAALLDQPERLAVLRKRLGSLSWYMRYLKEPVARRANAEDDCTGRFWEGRFRTQSLLDDPAVLACMVYVDLNPLRAGTANSIEQSKHTSAHRRLRARLPASALLSPVSSSIESHIATMSTAEYVTLMKWTARSFGDGKPKGSYSNAPPILERLNVRPEQWLIQVRATESRYWRAIGCVESLLDRARALGLCWLRGIGTARALEREPHPV